jgi:multiple antibiotic resistance protein
MLKDYLSGNTSFFLMAFPALFAIINPVGGAFLFLAATQHFSQRTRNFLARRVAIFSFFMLNVSMLIGAFVLRVFGISMPVLRVAGGIVIALSAWKLLNADGSDAGDKEAAIDEAAERNARDMAFYPLTMPVTTGPGTIAVAIALGTDSAASRRPLPFAFQAFATTALICLLIYGMYYSSSRISKLVGATGTQIIGRLSAFLLFCIGIQVMWGGLAELITSLRPAVSPVTSGAR